MSFNDTISKVLERFLEVEKNLTLINDPEKYIELSKEYSELQPIANIIKEYKNSENEVKNLSELLNDSENDKEMRELVLTEILEHKGKIEELDKQIKIMLLPKDKADDKNAILEIRAGTGGDEAALFAGDIFRMYSRYAEKNGWKLDLISANEGEMGGFKEVIVSINAKGVYSKLKYESGVHRVQRVPSTESSGRIHTSAATVAVLPEAEEVDVEIEDKDIRIDVYRASGPGGQSVNTTDSAVRITHLPTGIVVTQQDEKSQHKNRAKALRVLRSRLYEMERQKIESERSEVRKGQVGSGDRSERIRTYNFPQGRVTDHRINLTLYKLDTILEGDDLDEIIDALIAEERAQKLTNIE